LQPGERHQGKINGLSSLWLWAAEGQLVAGESGRRFELTQPARLEQSSQSEPVQGRARLSTRLPRLALVWAAGRAKLGLQAAQTETKPAKQIHPELPPRAMRAAGSLSFQSRSPKLNQAFLLNPPSSFLLPPPPKARLKPGQTGAPSPARCLYDLEQREEEEEEQEQQSEPWASRGGNGRGGPQSKSTSIHPRGCLLMTWDSNMPAWAT